MRLSAGDPASKLFGEFRVHETSLKGSGSMAYSKYLETNAVETDNMLHTLASTERLRYA